MCFIAHGAISNCEMSKINKGVLGVIAVISLGHAQNVNPASCMLSRKEGEAFAQKHVPIKEAS
jgi:hypothetical protein